jgi:hypothetical protein
MSCTSKLVVDLQGCSLLLHGSWSGADTSQSMLLLYTPLHQRSTALWTGSLCNCCYRRCSSGINSQGTRRWVADSH